MANFQFTWGLCCCRELLGVLVLVLVVFGLPHKLVLAQAMELVVSKALQTRLYCRLLVTQDLQQMVAL